MRQGKLNKAVLAVGLGHLTVTALTWRDIRQRPAAEIKGEKRVWRLLTAVNTANSAIYWLLGRRLGPVPVAVRPCTQDELTRLLESTPSASDRRHHIERFGMQSEGKATYLIAWEEEPRGRGTVLHESKYPEVRESLGTFPEINALAAYPSGHGIGSALLSAAEDVARGLGADRVGLAVSGANHSAIRLYQRMGYAAWDGKVLVDRWYELKEDGSTAEHDDEVRYFTKWLAEQ